MLSSWVGTRKLLFTSSSPQGATLYTVCEVRPLSFPGPVRCGWSIGCAPGGRSTVQLLPLFAYLSQSSDLFYRKQSIYLSAQALRAAIVLLIPNYFGNPASRFWGPGNYNEISGSVDLLPWILAPCTLLGGWSRKETKFFLGLGDLCWGGSL